VRARQVHLDSGLDSKVYPSCYGGSP
jgi:hypothetical protein